MNFFEFFDKTISNLPFNKSEILIEEIINYDDYLIKSSFIKNSFNKLKYNVDDVFIESHNESNLKYLNNKILSEIERLLNSIKILIQYTDSDTIQKIIYLRYYKPNEEQYSESDSILEDIFLELGFENNLYNNELFQNFVFVALLKKEYNGYIELAKYLNDSFKNYISDELKTFKYEYKFFEGDEFNIDTIYLSDSLDTDLNDYSNTGLKEKIIALKELGILDYLQKEYINCQTSTNKLAEVLSLITGGKSGTVQSYINPIINTDTSQKNNPYSNPKTVEKAKNKLNIIGVIKHK